MKNLLRAYVVLATVVGISIITLLFVGIPLKYAHEIWPGVLPEGSRGQTFGENLNTFLGVAHGWVYAVFLFVAFTLLQRAGWAKGPIISTLLLGTVPFWSFVAEARTVKQLRADRPELR